MSKVYAKYIGDGDNGVLFIPGVPQRDLNKGEWDSLTDHQRARVAGVYEVVSPAKKDNGQ